MALDGALMLLRIRWWLARIGTGFDAGGDIAALIGRGGLANFCIKRLDSIVVGTELLRFPEFGSSSKLPDSSSELPKLLMLDDKSELGWDEKQFR